MKKKHMEGYRKKIDKLEFITVLLMAIISLTIFIVASWYTCMKISQALQSGMTEISEMAKKSINDNTVEKVSALSSAFQLGLFETGLTIIGIAVTVWIGLNIYNNFKESILEQQLKKVEHKYEVLNWEYQRVLFLTQLEKTESSYEVSRFFYEKFKEEDVEEENLDEGMFDELIQVEKIFQACCSAYEQKRLNECRDYAKNVISAIQNNTKKCKKSSYILLRLYIEIRYSDALFYINISNEKLGEKVDKGELLSSIEKYQEGLTMLKEFYEFKNYKEHDDIVELNTNKEFKVFREDNQCDFVGEEQRELLGYMYNTIGYTYLRLLDKNPSNQEWISEAKRYLIFAAANNAKGRYAQNLGSYYERSNDDESFENALFCYKEALKSANPDKKVYNLIGSLYLKMVDKRIGINERFKYRKTIKNMYSHFGNEGTDIKNAYMYLDRAVKVNPELVDVYYNFAKANLYFWLWSGCKDGRKKNDADMYIKTALELQPENIGALYTQRNYYEAIGEIEKANEINKRLIEKRKRKGDEGKAEELYADFRKEERNRMKMQFKQYIKEIFQRQNIGANKYTYNLKEEEAFERLLRPVYEIYMQTQKKEEKFLFSKLYQQSGLQEKITEFICEQKQAPGMVLVFGTAHHRELIALGNQQELDDDESSNIIPMQQNSIFDMASITKIFTCLSILKLADMNVLKLSDDIFELDNRFIHLGGITVEDLLSFKVPLKTADRIENAQCLEQAEQFIFEMEPNPTQTRLYSDMGAMVLKYVIEHLTGQAYYDFVREHILNPCNMQDTVIEILPKNLPRTVSNNFERRIQNSDYIVLNHIKKGIVNDGKARNINQFKVQLHGHAGMFSTVEDMSKLAQTLMQGKIIDPKWLDKIGVNQTGKQNDDGSFTQFHGYLCYSKNPVEKNSEVNHFLSGNAFALGGYTGNQLTIDSVNQVFSFMASNRCHNRVTSVLGEDLCIKDGYADWNDGNKYLYNKKYAYERDKYVVKPAIELALQYRFLECLLDGKI